MTPFFFGESTLQLFGAYHPANGGGARGVLLCYPWAREYLLAHATFRLLAQRLADHGWHALRFDYRGTGDSAGDARAGGQAEWLQDVNTAVEELCEMATISSLALVGLRHGATLAALAAARRSDVDRLVLWDPVYDGRRYLAEIGAAPDAGDEEIDLLGSVMDADLRRELGGITLSSFRALGRTLILCTGHDPLAARPLADHLRANGVDCAEEHVPDIPVWREEWGRGGKALAVRAVDRIVTWLA